MQSTYHLIGAGGTGSIVAPHLLRHLRKTHDGKDFVLYIVDGDLISEKNVSRQDFNPNHVGKPKAAALAARLGGMQAKVIPINDYIDTELAAEWFREGDTILIAVDNYRARADIEAHALTMRDVTVINAGNEANTSSTQIWMRRSGRNITPPLSYQHEEILTPGMTREEESCMVRAESPDSDQTIAANLMSAAWMLSALYHVQSIETLTHYTNSIAVLAGEDTIDPDPLWHELHVDLQKGKAGGPDWRQIDRTDTWRTWTQPIVEPVIAIETV